MTDDPIRRAWEAWKAYERRTDVQLSLDWELHLTGPQEDDTLQETERQEQPK
jgi:hypothetical protein